MKTTLLLFSIMTMSFMDAQWVDGGISITTNDKVGIGTNNPDATLHITDQGNSSVYSLKLNNRISFRGDGVVEWGSSSNYGILSWDVDRALIGAKLGSGLSLYSNGSEKMRISQNGNIGILTSNPNSQFVLSSNFGANISGSTGGNAVFGSNLAVVQGGVDHNKLITPSSHNGNYGYSGMRSSWGKLYFYTKYGNTTQGEVITDNPRMIIDHYGKVGIGTVSPDAKLTVKGNIHAEEVKVDLSVPGPDYVFKEGYDLKSLAEVKKYIEEKGHLPNIPSAQEMEENGIQLGEMNMKLLEKIEELTLYTLQQEHRLKEMEELQAELKFQKRQIEELKALIIKLLE